MYLYTSNMEMEIEDGCSVFFGSKTKKYKDGIKNDEWLQVLLGSTFGDNLIFPSLIVLNAVINFILSRRVTLEIYFNQTA